MNSKVKVIAGKNGQVVQQSTNNPNYGYIQVAQTRVGMKNNFMETRRLVAIIPGSLEDLRNANWKENQDVDGKIIIRESVVPFNDDNPDLDIKTAGKTGVVCKIGEDPIYRKHFYVTDPEAQDVLLEHTNSSEIKIAYNAPDFTV